MPELNNISRRDYFAAMAMQGLLACQSPDWHIPTNNKLTETAVEIADMLIAHLNAKPQQDDEPPIPKEDAQ